MNNIKIFVSHRIDKNSQTIDNPLYIPVRCGAIFDKRKKIAMQGDDTGENISEKRNNLCELTVQYWAWKNVDADYYGLCHYRRYLDFGGKKFKTNVQNQIVEPILSNSLIKKHKLQKKAPIEQSLHHNEAILPEPADVRKFYTPAGYFPQTVRQLWKAHEGLFIKEGDLELLLKTIKRIHPEYLNSAINYLKSYQHCGFNCYILRRDLFREMCQFQFDILFAIEMQININTRSGSLSRSLGYLGEIMFGIFSHELSNRKNINIQRQQIIFFSETEKTLYRPLINLKAYSLYACRQYSSLILPQGSQRRNFAKKIYKRLLLTKE